MSHRNDPLIEGTKTLDDWLSGQTVATEDLISELAHWLAHFAGSIIPTHDEIVKWMERKGTTLWADFIVSEGDGRQRAAEWLHKEITDLFAHAHRSRS